MIPSNSVGPLSDSALNRIDDEPMGPVKILRRPKPQPGGTGQGQLGSQFSTNGTSGAQTPTLASQHAHADAASWSKPSCNTSPIANATTTSIYDNDDEWPSIADASKCQGSQKKPQQPQQQRLSVMKKPTTFVKCQPQNGAAQGSSTPGHDNNNVVRSKATVNNQPRPTGPVKTYKERADDYAKARLRILGSAFSEDDQRDNVAFR